MVVCFPLPWVVLSWLFWPSETVVLSCPCFSLQKLGIWFPSVSCGLCVTSASALHANCSKSLVRVIRGLLSAPPHVPTAGHWKGLFFSHSFIVLLNPSAVFCLWAVKEFNLSLLTLPKEPVRFEFPISHLSGMCCLSLSTLIFQLTYRKITKTATYRKTTKVKPDLPTA